MHRKEIALIKETRQSKFVGKIMDKISPQIKINPSDKIAIKINLSGFREIYANTHYETVESLIGYIRDNWGVKDITVIEGSDGAYYAKKNTWDIFYKFRYKEVELMGVKLCNLDDLPHDKKLQVKTLKGDQEIKYTEFESDYMISVVPPKTHNIFPVFLSIPNLAGFVAAEERKYLYGALDSEIRELKLNDDERYFRQLDNSGRNFAALLKKISPSLVLIDGLYGMEGKGPVRGSPVFHGFAAASEDPVLADSLTTFLMGFDIDEVPYLYYSYREQLGNNRWHNVQGVDPARVKFPYRPHPTYQKQKLWKSMIKKNNTNGEKSNAGSEDDRNG